MHLPHYLGKMPNYPCNIYIYTITDKLYNKPHKCPISQNYLDTVLSGCRIW